MGKTVKDRNLHKIAALMSENESVRERVCVNIYKGKRVTQLREATEAMQAVKTLLVNEKKGERLTEGEKKQLQEARALQHEIITVDAFEHDVYMRSSQKAE
jgi:hypothetical protein